MIIGLLFFWNGVKNKVFGDKGLPPNPKILKNRWGGIQKKYLIIVLTVLSAPIIGLLLSSYKAFMGGSTFLGDQNVVNILFQIIGVIILGYLIYILFQVKIEERKKLIVAIFITFFMTIFWGFHELSGSVITLFAERNVNLSFINASQTNSLNSMFIILLAIPISLMWQFLAKKKKNPRTPYKFGLGLILAGISFYVLSISGAQVDTNGMVPFIYLVLMYLLISIGELFMSPIGLSKITDLSPQRIVAFMMGIWFLSSAYAFQLVGFIGKKMAVESTSANVQGFDSLAVYVQGFDVIAKYALVAGIVVLIIAPLLKKLMGEVH